MLSLSPLDELFVIASTHFVENAKASLEKGMYVLIEKPVNLRVHQMQRKNFIIWHKKLRKEFWFQMDLILAY